MTETATSLRREPARSPADPAARPLDSASTAALMRFHRSPLLADGRVNVLTLDAIADRLGDKWDDRRAQVYERVERALKRRLGRAGFFLRVSEVDYLVAQPDAGRFGAQAVCLRVMDEVMSFFMGSRRRRDDAVHCLTQLASDQLVIAPISRRLAADGACREAEWAALGQNSDEGELLAPGRWSPFVASNGRHVRVSCTLEPVFEVKNHTRIGYRLRRRVLDTRTEKPLTANELHHLSRADLLRIDMATIARGLARLSAAADHEAELSLIVPVSYVVLAHVESRHLIAEAFAKVRETVLKGVICEVFDVAAAPPASLAQAVSLIKPHTLFVVGHLEDSAPYAPSSMKDSGLRGLSLQCPANITGDAEFIGWLRQVAASTQKVSKSLLLYGCPNPRRAAMAALGGASHVSFAAAS